MASKDTHVTAEQFNEFAKTLIDTLNKTHEYIYKRFDSIENRLSAIETDIVDLRKSVSGIQSNVASVKQDTKLLPPIFELLEQDGEDIAQLRTRVEKMEN